MQLDHDQARLLTLNNFQLAMMTHLNNFHAHLLPKVPEQGYLSIQSDFLSCTYTPAATQFLNFITGLQKIIVFVLVVISLLLDLVLHRGPGQAYPN